MVVFEESPWALNLQFTGKRRIFKLFQKALSRGAEHPRGRGGARVHFRRVFKRHPFAGMEWAELDV